MNSFERSLSGGFEPVQPPASLAQESERRLSPPEAKVEKARALVESRYPGEKKFFQEELDEGGYRKALLFSEAKAGEFPDVIFRVPLPDNPVNMTEVERLELAPDM